VITDHAGSTERTGRVRNNRILIALAVLAIVAGVWLGQALITWLNATLL
jgi:hypothetical protein